MDEDGDGDEDVDEDGDGDEDEDVMTHGPRHNPSLPPRPCEACGEVFLPRQRGTRFCGSDRCETRRRQAARAAKMQATVARLKT